MVPEILFNRYQQGVINGLESKWKCVNADVPQGSTLGPLLFKINTNDIVDDFECVPLIYADDINLLKLLCNM